MTESWEHNLQATLDRKFGDIENYSPDGGKTHPFKYVEANDRTAPPACGFFTISRPPENSKSNNDLLHYTLSTGDIQDGTHKIQSSISVNNILKCHEDECLQFVSDYLRAKGLVNKQAPFNETDFKRIFIQQIHRATQGQSGEFALIEHKNPVTHEPILLGGVFDYLIHLPIKDQKYISLVFHIKPPAHFLSAGDNYQQKQGILNVTINTLTNDENIARKLKDVAIKTLQDYFGIIEADLSQVVDTKRGQKPLDPSWIDPDQIKILDLNRNTSTYEILVIPYGNSPLNRRVTVASGTKDRGRAEEACERVKEYTASFKLGGEREGQELTLKGIGQYIHEKISVDPVEYRPRAQPFKHVIVAGGDTKMVIRTPTLVGNKDERGIIHHSALLKFEPSRSNNYGCPVVAHVERDVNTPDRALATLRMDTLNRIAVAALEQYFQEHPHDSIVTKTYKTNQNGEEVTAKRFDGKMLAVPPPPGQIYFDDLREKVIKPALEDYSRYISWETQVAQGDDRKWNVTFQTKRNDNGEAVPGNDEPFTVRFDNEKRARNFADTLEAKIIGEQFHDSQAQTQSVDWQTKHKSRERAVERFGQSSQNLVFRESLRSTLGAFPDADLMGSNRLATLKNPPKEPGISG